MADEAATAELLKKQKQLQATIQEQTEQLMNQAARLEAQRKEQDAFYAAAQARSQQMQDDFDRLNQEHRDRMAAAAQMLANQPAVNQAPPQQPQAAVLAALGGQMPQAPPPPPQQAQAAPAAAFGGPFGGGILIDPTSVPIFTGDDDDGTTVEDFIVSLEGMVKLWNLNQQKVVGIMQHRTRGSAQRFLNKLSPVQISNMASLKSAFYQEYKSTKSREQLEREFSGCAQQQFEATKDFYRRLKKIAYQLQKAAPAAPAGSEAAVAALMEDRVIMRFTTGLRPEIRRSLVGRKPKSLQEARDWAIEAEEVDISVRVQEVENRELQNRSVAALLVGQSSPTQEKIRQLEEEELAYREARVSALRLAAATASTSSAPLPGDAVGARRESRGILKPSTQPGTNSNLNWPPRPGRPKSPRRVQYHFNSDGAKVKDYSCLLCRDPNHWMDECPHLKCGLCNGKHRPCDCPTLNKTTPKN